MKRRFATIGPKRGPEVDRVIAQSIHRLRQCDVLGIAFVIVTPRGAVETGFSGHRSGQWHTINSGISILRQRFDREAK